jgi:hypothetical protein
MNRPQLKLQMSTKMSATLKDADKLRRNAAEEAQPADVSYSQHFHRQLGDRALAGGIEALPTTTAAALSPPTLDRERQTRVAYLSAQREHGRGSLAGLDEDTRW